MWELLIGLSYVFIGRCFSLASAWSSWFVVLDSVGEAVVRGFRLIVWLFICSLVGSSVDVMFNSFGSMLVFIVRVVDVAFWVIAKGLLM